MVKMEAALITDAVATPYHALSRAQLTAGKSAMITGIGGLGVHALQIAHLWGASPVIAVDAANEKLELAKKLGADYVVNPLREDALSRVKEITGGLGVDVAVELIGLFQTLRLSLDCTRVGGRTMAVGIFNDQLPFNPYQDLILKEAAFLGSADQNRHDFPAIIDMVAQGQIDLQHSVSHTLPLQDVN